jgi:hypothetical protein
VPKKIIKLKIKLNPCSRTSNLAGKQVATVVAATVVAHIFPQNFKKNARNIFLGTTHP